MYYVYVLQSMKDRLFYTGFTTDLDRRVKEHNRMSKALLNTAHHLSLFITNGV
jgi:predicted GIY-YIG superfamily endonuclease